MTVPPATSAARARDVLATLGAQRDGLAALVTTMKSRVEAGYSPESDLLRFQTEAARMDAEVARTLEQTLELGRL